MSAATIWTGLRERFLTVPGLATNNVILGEPTAAQTLPLLYTSLARFERAMEGSPPGDNLTSMRYFFDHRLLVRWQDNANAEAELLSFVNTIPYSITSDPTLGGRISRGHARITEGVAGFVTIAGTLFRVLDFSSDILEKAPRSTAL